MVRLRAQAKKQRGQQHRSRPIVDHAVAVVLDLVGVRADHDDLLGFAGQNTNDVRRKLAGERLLGKIRVRASRFGQPLSDQRLALAIFSRERLQVGFNLFARLQAEMILCRSTRRHSGENDGRERDRSEKARRKNDRGGPRSNPSPAHANHILSLA